jgi:hypothetical protein
MDNVKSVVNLIEFYRTYTQGLILGEELTTSTSTMGLHGAMDVRECRLRCVC